MKSSVGRALRGSVVAALLGATALFSPAQAFADSASSELPDQPGQVVGRTADSVTTKDAAGDMHTRVFPDAVNFREDGEGAWRPIVLDLEPTTGGVVSPAAVDGDLDIPSSLGAPVTLRRGDERVDVRLLGASGSRSVSGDTATFKDALPGVDAVYKARSGGVKETIVADNAQAAAQIRYSINAAADLTAAAAGDQVTLKNAAGETVFAITAPLAWDSAPQPSHTNELELSIEKISGGKWILTVTPNAAWLSDPARVGKIHIDPDYYWVGNDYTTRFHGADLDCAVTSGTSANNNYCASTLLSAGNAYGRSYNSLVRFDVSKAIPAYATPTRAQFMARATTSAANSAGTRLKTITSPWTSAVTWNQRAASTPWTTPGGTTSTDPTLTGADIGTHPSGPWYYWDTPLATVQGWVKGTLPNNGFQLSGSAATSLFTYVSTEGNQDSWPALDVEWNPDRTAPPAPQLTGTGSQNGAYLGGTTASAITATATDENSGVALIELLRGSTPLVYLDSDCPGNICPQVLTEDLPFNTTNWPEGANTLTIRITDKAGNITSTPWSIWVDRTAPTAVPGGNVAGFDSSVSELTIGWGTSTDPVLADGSPGSGVTSYSARARINGGPFGPWSDFDPDGGYIIEGAAAGSSVAVEVKAVDSAGNASTVTSNSFVASAPTFPDGGLLIPDDEETTASATASAAPLPDQKYDKCGMKSGFRGQADYQRDSRTYPNVLFTASRIPYCQTNAEKVYVRVEFIQCLQVKIGGAWKRFSFRGDSKCEKRKIDAGANPGIIKDYEGPRVVNQHLCYPGTHDIRGYAAINARRRDGSLESYGYRAGRELNGLVCNMSGAWQVIAGDVGSSAPGTVLGDRLFAAKDYPPGDDRGLGKRRGFEAHHIVPARENGAIADQAQARAYSCSNILPNQIINGVWLRGPQLRSSQEWSGSTTNYDQLGSEGKRRALHTGIHTDEYFTWVRDRLDASFDPNYQCNEASAATVMNDLSALLKDKTNKALWQNVPGDPDGLD